MLENCRANMDENQCARYMTKYGGPQLKSASEILKLSVSLFGNDDQVAEDRDMAAQETAYTLLV